MSTGSINWDSIIAKAKSHMDSPKMQREVRAKIDRIMLGIEVAPHGMHSVEDAGVKFADVLIRTIQSSGLSPNVIDRLLDIDVGRPMKLSDNTYMIYVSFNSDLERHTMSTKKKYYEVNLAKLYNNGVDHVMDRIWEWDELGGVHSSNDYIPGEHFAERAIDDFLGNFGTEYNVIRIKDSFYE